MCARAREYICLFFWILTIIVLQAEEGNCPVMFQNSKAPIAMEQLRHLSEISEKYLPNNILERCKDPASKR